MQRIFHFLLSVFLLQGMWPTQIVLAQSATDGFNPNASGPAYAIAIQADDKLVVGGAFSTIGAQALGGLARLNRDGSVDASVNLAITAGGTVNALAVQADGKIVFGGYFSQVGSTTRNNLARLGADGSLDAAFDPNANGVIRTLAVQKDGRIVIGGTFTQIGSTTRNYLARLNPDGSLDASFVAAAITTWVTTLALQPDGKLLVGGGSAQGIVRLNADGSLDTSFTVPAINFSVASLALQIDGKVLAGGTAPQAHAGLARFNADGTLDASFTNPDVTGNGFAGIFSIAMQSDGKILIAGNFGQVAASAHAKIARLNADGSLDAGFNANVSSASNSVNTVVVQRDGKLVLGGDFNQVNVALRNKLARLYADGSVDGDFSADADGVIYALAQQPDGKTLVGGNFTHIATLAHNYLARLNPDGSVDDAFNPSASGVADAFVVMPDGKIIVGGYFSTISNQTCDGIARLSTDGSVDTTFSANTNGYVFALAAQADGKLIVGGSFGTIGGHARPGIARLNADGSVDESFNPNALGTTTHYVYALALQPDGRVIVGGGFLPVGSQDEVGLLRLNADGSLDTAFNSNATVVTSPTNNSNIYVTTLQPDGKILVGGQFTTIGGQSRNRIARLNADGSVDAVFDPGADNSVFALTLRTDGEIIAGGAFTGIAGHARNYVGALNADGTAVGTAFNPNANGYVAAISIFADAKILLGGGFTTIGQPQQSRSLLARLSVQETAQQSIETNGSSVTWKRSGAGAELSLPPELAYSLDGDSFTPLGSMQRIAGAWRYTGLLQPPGQIYYLRTRARVASGSGNSQGLIENTRQLLGDDRIFSNAFE